MKKRQKGNKSGESYKLFCALMESVKRGEEVLVWGPGYVVMTQEYYKSLSFKDIGEKEAAQDKVENWANS